MYKLVSLTLNNQTYLEEDFVHNLTSLLRERSLRGIIKVSQVGHKNIAHHILTEGVGCVNLKYEIGVHISSHHGLLEK